MEYTLEPQLPNFGECWWDHVSEYQLTTYYLQCDNNELTTFVCGMPYSAV